MKFTTVFAVLATLATAVSATLSGAHLNTNAKRLANGLTPLPPVRRGQPHGGTPTHGGKPSRPSPPPGINNSCNGGTIQCCNSVTNANSSVRKAIEDLLGLVVAPNVAVGLTCTPLSAVGLSSGTCSQQSVCCEDNSFNGVVAVGCSPININAV
jgi:hypothetical protein